MTDGDVQMARIRFHADQAEALLEEIKEWTEEQANAYIDAAPGAREAIELSRNILAVKALRKHYGPSLNLRCTVEVLRSSGAMTRSGR